MYNNHTVGVVIPCYRVEKEIAAVIAQLPAFIDRIIAVDDAGPDGTAAVLDAMNDPRLIVIRHDTNQGVGGAMASGFDKALDLNLDVVVKIDGDGQMAPEHIVDLIDPLRAGICDYAKGNRFLHFRELRRMPLVRQFGNILLTFLTKVASGYWHIFDPQNGFVAIGRPYLVTLDLDRIRRRRYFFENEMLIQLNIVGARVLDCPMPAKYGNETSSLKISHILSYYPYLLLRGYFSRLYHRHVLRDFSIIIPLYFFGFSLFAFGVVFGINAWVTSARLGVATPTGTVMIAVLPLILGFQMLMQGLMLEILQSPRADSAASRTERSRGRADERSDLSSS